MNSVRGAWGTVGFVLRENLEEQSFFFYLNPPTTLSGIGGFAPKPPPPVKGHKYFLKEKLAVFPYGKTLGAR